MRHYSLCLPFLLLLLNSCRARVWEKLRHHIFLVSWDTKHNQQYCRQWRAKLEDDSVSAGCVDHCLPGCHQGHSVLWKGEYKLNTIVFWPLKILSTYTVYFKHVCIWWLITHLYVEEFFLPIYQMMYLILLRKLSLVLPVLCGELLRWCTSALCSRIWCSFASWYGDCFLRGR